MANAYSRCFRLALIVLATCWLVESAVPADPEEKPIRLVVKLPEGAVLYIDGRKTQQTGKERTFETRPVRVGVDYYYHVKGVWKGADGKEVVKEVAKFLVKPGQANELDLLPKETPLKPLAKLKLTVPAAITVEAGGQTKINLKIERENCKSPVKVTFAGVPAGVKLADLTILADADSGTAELALSREVRIGTAELLVAAEAGEAKSEGKIKLSITEPLPANLTLIGPSAVDVEAGSRKTIKLKIIRSHFKGPVRIAFVATDAFKVPDATIDEDMAETKVELAPPKDAKAGTLTLGATGVGGGGSKAFFEIRVNILAPARPKGN